jgi:hypothetical protein
MTADLTHALRAQDLLDTFDTNENGMTFAWLGEDGDAAVLWGHSLDPGKIAWALDLEMDADEVAEDLDERWMIGRRHRPGCDGYNEDVCEACREKRHADCDAVVQIILAGCDCRAEGHSEAEVDWRCTCEHSEFAWWYEYLSLADACRADGYVIPVTVWST